ncbi:MAG TPA: hypothetical protein VL727_00270 [Puia sp.]|jgi:hypothetical protein|nr:hypothetical protein [Puia sp.]
MKKLNFYHALVVFVLILSAGCKKDIQPSSVGLTGQTKGSTTGFPGGPGVNPFPLANGTARLIAFDNGTGLNCLLGYDVSSNQVALIQNNATVWSTSGLNVDNLGTVNINTIIQSNNFNEIGGYHIIALDYYGNGHMDHLVVYAPGTGYIAILEKTGNGTWHALYQNSTGGIGGYDLKSTSDKIIAYDLGSGFKNSLICYRPGGGQVWAIQNQGGTWVGVVKGSSGIGGFDMKGANDQLIAVDNVPGAMNLVAYRPGPGLGYVWALSHQANSTTWTAFYTSRSGFPTFDLSQTQDRMIAYDESQSGSQTNLLCYRPGVNGYASVIFVQNGVLNHSVPQGSFFSYPMNANPNTSPSNIGDKIISFAGNNAGLSSIVCFQGGTKLVWVQETNLGSPLNFFQTF